MNKEYKSEQAGIIEYLCSASTLAVNDAKSAEVRFSRGQAACDSVSYASRVRAPAPVKIPPPVKKNTTHINCYITPMRTNPQTNAPRRSKS